MSHGSCLCGAIKFEFDENAVTTAFHCHCKDCQRVTGSGKATVAMFPETAVKIVGEIKTYSNRGTDGSHVKRGFCPNCGSQMFTFVEEIPDHVFIKAGTTDDSNWLKVALNCWTDSASQWLPADDNIPGVAKNPPVGGEV